MIIIADTSPLCYLILIDCIEILPKLYSQVIITEEVYQELQAPKTPEKVKQWILNHPDWLQIKSVKIQADSELDLLDLGEKSAIMLAEEIQADLIILDDKLARIIATKRGLNIIGLLGILYDAATLNLIDLGEIFDNLQQTSFFVSPQLLQSLLNQLNQQ